MTSFLSDGDDLLIFESVNTRVPTCIVCVGALGEIEGRARRSGARAVRASR